MNASIHIPLIACMVVLLAACSTPKKEASPLAAKIARFAPTTITADTSRLSTGDRAALRKLYAAARLMDSIYIRQVWEGNEALLDRLRADTSPEGMERLHYFKINMSPWSKIDGDSAFLSGVPAKRPPEANYYPADMTKEEFAAWLATLPLEEQKKATGFFTVIRRDDQHRLTMVPYKEEYKDLLVPAARLLKEAAAETDNATLKTYLTRRAEAFLNDDYYDSDLAWLDLDSPLDITIGPYEVYLDDLFNYRAAFEAFITLRNEAETAKLSQFAGHLQEVENNLPIEKRYRNPALGALAPIRVVDEVDIGGEARAGVQTAAFNLPNDEKVVSEKGSKRVMLRNVQEAKFTQILLPIAAKALEPSQREKVGFEPFFTHILAHELMHGLGPHNVMVGGKKTTVRQQMKELGSALEEAKADVSGLFMLQYLIDHGIVEKSVEEPLYVTFLASTFRTLRFGSQEAHGKGMVLQFNYITDEGGFVYDTARGTFSVDYTRVKGAVRKLTAEIMTIQAEGDYQKAKALLDKYSTVRPNVQKFLDSLTGIPVDIEPRFPLVD